MFHKFRLVSNREKNYQTLGVSFEANFEIDSRMYLGNQLKIFFLNNNLQTFFLKNLPARVSGTFLGDFCFLQGRVFLQKLLAVISEGHRKAKF